MLWAQLLVQYNCSRVYLCYMYAAFKQRNCVLWSIVGLNVSTHIKWSITFAILQALIDNYINVNTDVYGLGATAFHLITLERPWHQLPEISTAHKQKNREQVKKLIKQQVYTGVYKSLTSLISGKSCSNKITIHLLPNNQPEGRKFHK